MSKTTSFVLGEHFDQFIASQLENGRFASASEVIREGLRLMVQREQMMEAMDTAIQIGLDSGVDEGFSWDAVKKDGKALAKGQSTFRT